MRMLVIYSKFRILDRRTISDHLYSFKRYLKDTEIIYWDISSELVFKAAMLKLDFDIVVLHYTFLANRFDENFFDFYEKKLKSTIKNLSGIKVLIPHDEYIHTQQLRSFAKDCNAKIIFASCFEQDFETLFPKKQLGAQLSIFTVFTGYVDNSLVERIQAKTNSHSHRKYDIVYRALKAPFIFGKHGQLKSEVAHRFMQVTALDESLKVDISLTNSLNKNTIVGDKWIDFLLSSRCSLGCLGGSSLMDETGKIDVDVRQYLQHHPNADYNEVSSRCYKGLDGSIKSRLLGPKHFECAITKTCQVLVEGDYHGVLQPDVDYIPVKSDFSNISQVLEKIKNPDYCWQIADNCYENVVRSEKYTYKKYAEFVLENCLNYINENNIVLKNDNSSLIYLKIVRKCYLPIVLGKIILKQLSRFRLGNFYEFFNWLQKEHLGIYSFIKKAYYVITFKSLKDCNCENEDFEE